MFVTVINRIFSFFFSESSRKKFERVVFIVAILTFISHFLVIILANSGVLPAHYVGVEGKQNPIIAIYTPFTIILLYEIYLLIYYLPKSITIYLGKQYEIVTLIVIRKIFNDLGMLTFDNGHYDEPSIKSLVLTFAALALLLLLIFCYYKLSGNKKIRTDERDCRTQEERKFVILKKILAVCLMGVFIYLFIVSLIDLQRIPFTINGIIQAMKTVNNAFFFSFFTALILLEVLLLLFTFNLSDKFNKVIRNSGFIISTILLKLSFRVEGRESLILILVAVSFGVAIMGIHRLYEKRLQ